jgi:hypothetical protein
MSEPVATSELMPSSGSNGSARFWPWGATALILSFLVAFSFGFTPIRSTQDDFWHLKAGQLQIEQGLPIHGPEPFSYNDPGHSWHNHEWLAQRIFYRIYAWGSQTDFFSGMFRLIVFKSLVVGLTFALVTWAVRRRGTHWILAALMGIIAAEISRRTIYIRPPLFSYFLFAGFLLCLHEWRMGRLPGRWLWFLPAVTILWANLHGMVQLAVAAVGAYAGGHWLTLLVIHEGSMKSRLTAFLRCKTNQLITAVLGATFLATLLQPSGIGLYTLAGKFTRDPLLQRTISEMLPPPFFIQFSGTGWHFIPGFATFWVVVALVFLLWAFHRGRLHHPADGILLLFFTYQALNHWRLLPLFAIVAAPILGWLISHRFLPVLISWQPWIAKRLTPLLLTTTLLLSGTYVGWIGEPPPQTFLVRNRVLLGGQVLDGPMDYPMPIVQALLNARPPGHLYSPSNHCGWFIWWLAPETYRTFADNRFDHFGSQFLYDELILQKAMGPGVSILDRQVTETWQQVLERHGIQTLAIQRNMPLHRRLRTWPDFQPVYYFLPPGQPRSDGGWAIWVRVTDESTTARETLRRLAMRENPGLPPPELFENWQPDPNSPELPFPGESPSHHENASSPP